MVNVAVEVANVEAATHRTEAMGATMRHGAMVAMEMRRGNRVGRRGDAEVDTQSGSLNY